MMDFWFILVASIIVIWSSSFSGQRFKLESKDFIFHILQRNFSNFGMKIGVQQKVFRAFIFPYFVLSWYILVQSLVERFPKRIYIFLFLFSSGIYLFKLIKTTGSFSKASILINKNHLVGVFWGLHITCKCYHNLSIKRENYQLD